MTEKLSARLVPFLLLIGFVLAVGLRVLIGGANVAQSSAAGLAFAAALGVLCFAGGLRTVINRRTVWVVLLGVVVLCIVPLIRFISTTPPQPAGNYAYWVVVVSVVAIAEEAFLRGTFLDSVMERYGGVVAIGASAILFALLHVPLYGWSVLPLDIVVGVWFGVLRLVSGSWVAPGIAHAFADIASWWLV